MNNSASFDSALSNWLTLHSLNRRPRTVEFNGEIAATIRKHWTDASADVSTVNIDVLLAFSLKVSHYCPSRWNAIVSALRFVTPAAKALPFRRLNIKQFSPPPQLEFDLFLAECDASRRSKAGLVVRFLCLTGMRITEARSLRWENVKQDHIEVLGCVTKNTKGRSIPFFDGLPAVLDRLRALDKKGFVLPRANARKAIQTACRRAGVTQMSFHSFRHLFATKCIEAGVPIPTVARWLGHQDGGALAAKTYYHLADENSRAMAGRVKIFMMAIQVPVIVPPPLTLPGCPVLAW